MTIGSRGRRSAAGRAVVALSVLMFAALLWAVPLGAEEPSLQVASGRISGTFLAVTPEIPYETALLRVAGPDGYAVTRTFDAVTPITLDLVADAESRLAADQTTAAGEPLWTQAATGPLPDGLYHYEVVFTDRGREAQVHSGRIFVEGGAAVPQQQQSPPPPGPEGLAVKALPSEDPSPMSLNIQDFLWIQDPNDTGQTWVRFDSASDPVRRISNQGGVTNFHTGLTGGPGNLGEVRMSILPAGNVGIGTTAPTAPLEIATSFPGIQMNLGAGQWRLSAFSDPAFGVRNTDNSTHPFVIHPTAPQNAMRITGDGIGLGMSPGDILAGLHVRGNAFASPTTMIVERTDGGVANIRFRSTGGGGPTQNWLFQNNPANLVFAIRDESGGTSPFRIFGGSPENNFVVRGARWGLNVANPAHPIDTSTGARLSAGGVWQNASSRTFKDDIESLSVAEALETLLGLEPIKYAYKADPDERHVGFIAEDVPALVATADRMGLSSMDIAAVLTRVAQEQHGLVQELRGTLEVQQQHMRSQQDELAMLRARLAALEALLLEASEARLMPETGR